MTRALYSFPHRIGAGRICTTAWYQVAETSDAGVDFVAAVGSTARALPADVRAVETLARGRFRIPYRVLGGRRMFELHDKLVARWLRKHADQIDVVHTWPLGALETLQVAAELQIPTVLERPNAHTRYAYEVVKRECDRLGVALPDDHEHAFNADVLAREEAEYAVAAKLLCPSDFVARTFRDAGYAEEKLVRHQYGVDIDVFVPSDQQDAAFTALFVGVAAVRKGLHFALEAWHRSPARARGRFLIAGEILPDYARVLAPLLQDRSVTVLGHSTQVPELMRRAHVLLLPSIEEGSALVCAEAMASGCVPLVSDAATSICETEVNGLVHRVGDIDALTDHLSRTFEDGEMLNRLRDGAIRSRDSISWRAAGRRLAAIYAEVAASGS